ncbi:MAG: hypothetical protein COB67_07105 [SAR324 cluster bacterium]|uniref:Uncharacterized protein n=1 Tax=SAR324 cluster bacterium TaxID=2024889 RepID=A0A2A4T3X5_9DELT|nr:MAG: hypothetical protein COB67_07105 [SAR324 cluster bacterium]
MKKLLKLLLIASLIFMAGGLAWGQDEDEEQDNSIRSNPENFEPATQLEKPSDLLKSEHVFRQVLRTVPTFTVDPREEEMDAYPCTDCHDNDEQMPNAEIRNLEEDHESIQLVHGNGRFWCLTCHNEDDRDQLTSLKNQPISFNESYLLCGQCHFQRQKDFFYGGHGKRKGNWQGDRKLSTCTECHNPHVPQIKGRNPVAQPKIRTGLSPTKTVHQVKYKPWEIKPKAGAAH